MELHTYTQNKIVISLKFWQLLIWVLINNYQSIFYSSDDCTLKFSQNFYILFKIYMIIKMHILIHSSTNLSPQPFIVQSSQNSVLMTYPIAPQQKRNLQLFNLPNSQTFLTNLLLISIAMALKCLVEKMVEFFERAADKLGCDRTAGARLLTRGLSFLHNNKMIRENKKENIGKKLRKMREEEDDDEVWRRTIMMGEKCQPLEFSGVICYDTNGKRVATAPRSPLQRSTPESSLHFF